MGYDEVYRRSLSEPDAFWRNAATALQWDAAADKVRDAASDMYPRWFADWRGNVCANAVDRHVEAGFGDQVALIYDSPVRGERAQVTFAALQTQVAHAAGMLQRLGVAAGDRVLIYMPNSVEAVVAMLACARIGAIHSVVFGGFAAPELATRIRDAQPRAILASSCGVEVQRVIGYVPIVQEALALAGQADTPVVVRQRKPEGAVLDAANLYDWDTLCADATPADPVSLTGDHPLYILYTSGTTGVPKGVVHDHGGTMVALRWSMEHVYDAGPGDVYWAASDIGWVVGHSYMVYGPLLQRCTTIIYEGKPVGAPDAGAFWRVIAEYGVNVLFTAPTAFRAIKREDPDGTMLSACDTGTLRALFLAGERADPDTIRWAERLLGVPVIDHWWQTETGWPIAANCLGIEPLPVRYGSPTKPVPGYDVQILDEGGQELPAGQTGAIVVRLPLPPGCLTTLWQNQKGFEETYLSTFPGCYETKDAGYCDEDGYLFVMSRTDDIINVAGHRFSTGGFEEIIANHPDVAECAVIGIRDAVKGQVPIAFVVLSSGVSRQEAEIASEVVGLVRESFGAVAALRTVLVAERLPKTRSGKVLRGTMRRIADGDPWTMPATIDDPAILDEIEAALRRAGR